MIATIVKGNWATCYPFLYLKQVSLASEMSEQDSYLSSVDVKELENMASIGSGSSLSIDWNAVEDMVATIK